MPVIDGHMKTILAILALAALAACVSYYILAYLRAPSYVNVTHGLGYGQAKKINRERY